MDSEIAWDECVGDIQLDTNNLPPLNDLSSASSHLPNIDLLDLFSFDAHNAHASHHSASPTAPVQDASPSPAVSTAVASSVQQPRLSTPPPSPPPSSSSTDVVSLSDCDSNSNSNSNLNTTNSQSSDKSPPSPSSSLRSTHTTKHVKQEVPMNIDFHHHHQQQQEPQQRLSKKQKQQKQKQLKQQLQLQQQQQQAMDSSSTISSPNSSTTSPSYSPTPTPVTTTPSSPSSSSSAQQQARKGSSETDKAPELTDQSQDVGELRTRLASAVAEATALRQRVASLSEDNRHLRAALDHANARLIAVAQAAAPATAQQPVMLGLAHVTSDVAQRLTGALTISDPAAHQPQHHHHHYTDVSPPMRKKRKRVSGAAATTMACVMFMWGALVGSPGWLSHSNSASRTQAALPGVWKGSSSSTPATNSGVSAAAAAAAAGNGNNLNGGGGHWQPNCMRMLEQLPDGSGSGGANGEGEDGGGEGPSRLMKKAKIEPLMVVGNKMEDDEDDEDDDEPRNGPPCRSASASPMIIKEEKPLVDVVDGFGENQMTVDLNEDKQALARIEDVHMKFGSAVATSVPRYSYVLCRDAHVALDNVKACTQRMKNGLACGEPHTISLILPASAAGLSRIDGDLNDTADNGNHLDLAEVQCSVTAVARIPRPNQTAAKKFKGESLHQQKQKHGKTERHLHEHGHEDAAAGLYGKVIAMVPETGTVIADA